MNRWGTSIFLALAATPLMAAAQSNVTLYGRLDASVNYQRYSGTATRGSDSLTAVSSDTSFWGLRGSEDLGGGLRAYFKMESQFQIDTGAQGNPSVLFNREAYVGLGSSQYGQIQLGSQFAPAIWLSLKTDPFLRSNLGHNATLFQGPPNGYAIVYDNAIQYLTPTIGGFSGRVMASAGEGGLGPNWSASADYKGQSLYMGFVYDDYEFPGALVGRPGTNVDSHTFALAATYALPAVKLHAWAQWNKVSGLDKVKGYMLGMTVPVGRGEVRASVQLRDAGSADTTLFAAGYFHLLSKRTTLYGVVGKLNNEGPVAFGMLPSRAEGLARGFPAAGEDVAGIQLGIRHLF